MKERERNVGYNPPKKGPVFKIDLDIKPDLPLHLQPDEQNKYRPVRPNYLKDNPNDNG